VSSQKRLSVVLPGDLHTELKVYAAASGVPMNEIVQQAVIEYLNQTSFEGPDRADSADSTQP